jgi:hypothetical protein
MANTPGYLRALTVTAVASLAFAPAAMAQTKEELVDKGKVIASQPVRDFGLQKKDVPAVLVAARADPYTLAGLKGCGQLAAAIDELDGVLGADIDKSNASNGKIAVGEVATGAVAGVVNSFIPFRGVVREVSGAASADRRLAAATLAGASRRGFLKGTARARGCKV